MRDAVSIAFTSEQVEGVGTTFTCLTRVGPLRTTDRMVVTQWADGAAMGIRHEGAVTGQGRFTLEPDGERTRFRWDEELHFPWWMGGAVGATVASPVLKLVWRRNLRVLQRRFAPVNSPAGGPGGC